MIGAGHGHPDTIERPARASRSAVPSSTATISGQPGPQTDFLRSSADICVYGGAAGGGKTVGLVLEPLRHATRVANFTAVFFRRSTPQITNPGGLWDESQEFYPRVGGTPHVGMREWRWSRGGKIKFSHLQFDSTVYDWQGAQIALICFDELTHFTAHQFFYMVSRNRSTCGVRPYIRATCNPDADSWVADFLGWWINPESGLPIPERAGVLRYYVRVAEKTIWADRPEELVQYLPQPEDLPPSIEPPRPISVTFIPATVFNNPILLRANPEYYAWLLSLPTLERERLLGGNWKIRPAAGLYFKREWCTIVDELPADLDVVRYWDLAATEKTERNDPDWTVGIKLGRDRSGGYYLLDLVRARANPGDVERLLRNTAEQDGNRVRIGFGQDPGQAGKSQALHLVRALSAYTVRGASESGDKLTRFGPFSSQCRAGNVKIRRGAWNEELFRVLEGFPDLAHDDEVDACSGALEMLNPNSKDWGYIEWLREAAEEKKKQRQPEPREPNYAIGSVQWEEKQKKRRAADLARAAEEDKIAAERAAAAQEDKKREAQRAAAIAAEEA
jgi:predicted phage terminase large subunit-like protein